MKKKLLLIMATAIMIVLQSCGAIADEKQSELQKTTYYNICLIIDGTDRLCNQNDVPYVSVAEMESLASFICKNGLGTLYVSYVDKDCDNNKIAIFEQNDIRPSDIGRKAGYVQISKYNKEKEQRQKDQDAYDRKEAETINQFSSECDLIVSAAYSNSVAKQQKGSDVNGAINKAIRLLCASEQQDGQSFIILVSDGCDNVGKQLHSLPNDVKLLLVNSNVSKHHYEDIVSKEFASLKQAQKYIFNIH